MSLPRQSPWAAALLILSIGGPATTNAAAPEPASAPGGVLPVDDGGKPLNVDMEKGTLDDWRADGPAFAGQPVAGDTVRRRRSDMSSKHAGTYWVGSYERGGDAPKGTLTSRPFRVTLPFARFLVGGGSRPTTRVELVRADNQEVFFRASGVGSEELQPVAVDLTRHVGHDIFIRLVDQDSGGWGHLNFDDFKLFAARPAVPPRPGAFAPDVYSHQGLSPTDAAAAMTVPPGFHVTLFAGEPDVVQPIAMAIDDRGRIWVAEAYSYPTRVADRLAKDRILIFEDSDGDGRFDRRKVFADKLNLVSGLELGFGGVWVGAAPQFLFIPDADGDDRPDGPPRVLLDGWGHEDTHETLNSFAWGPDGWLYGCHGVFTHSRVGKPGTPDAARTPINAGIWRYHPTRHEFEVFAHGTSNPWGIDFNDRSQAFLTACVIPHLYQVIQGGRYERQAGPHFNPYTYDDIKTIADHRHYLGANPHAGNGRSDGAGGGHAHAGALIYLGARWPDEYRNTLFMNNIHGARLNRDVLEPRGSGYVGKHAPDFLLANDSWSQVVSLKSGPDGNVYMIDWYDKNQCHRREDEVHDRTNGRIFKISHGAAAQPPASLAGLDDAGLVRELGHPNQWHVRHARRLLQERAPGLPRANRDRLAQALQERAFGTAAETTRLDHLLAIHALGALDEPRIARGLADPAAIVRAWTIQLAMEAKDPSTATLARMAEMARSDASPVVRLYLASALQRLEPGRRWEILAGLLAHEEDASDPNLPLMTWYAAEPLAAVDMSRALELAGTSRLPRTLAFMARRIAAIGSPEAIALLVEAAGQHEGPGPRRAILGGLGESLKGRRRVDMPKAWPAVYRRLLEGGDAAVRDEANALALTFGDPKVLAAMRRVLGDGKADLERRRTALADLVRVHDPDLAATLQALIAEPALRGQAVRALAAYDDPKTPALVLKGYADLALAEKRDALGTLAARPDYARALLAAVGSKQVPSRDLSAEIIRQLRNLKDPAIDAEIAKVWGKVNDTPAEKSRMIAEARRMLTARPRQAPDVALGRAVFSKTCQQCHTLFAVGGKVGPELTGSNRADLDYVLSNVLDPSALIGKDYQAHVISTTDGRVLTGIVGEEGPNSITLLSANETVTIPRAEIDARKLSEQSMMPDDLWKGLSDHEVRSLVAYLASPAQTGILATPDTVATFFNGRDLARWEGDPKLWTVEHGEIVGKTGGLDRNEFLKSELVAADFRLTLEVKLVDDAGNSGIQFRSEPLAHGEVKGYQADVGPGWWGRLYEENGRALLWPQTAESHVRPGDWNTYEIVASGEKIRTFLNGHPCVHLDDPSGSRRGIFAFQLHSGGATEVRFKGLKLELDPDPGRLEKSGK